MKRFKTKALKDQVIVITGASSGIGLTTARMAAGHGARVVLAARNAQDLQAVTNDICRRGGRAFAVPTDVSDATAVEELGARGRSEFGSIDTWVNNAGLSIYGKLTDVPLEDERRLFDINFWGVVHGCRTAVRLMKDSGGVLINLGSQVSELAIPLQGIYSASKRAVKGYTDALRMELEHDDVPIAVTLVMPSAINTPYPEHARNYLDEGVPALPPPIYAPEVVARAILHCAERPVRDVVVGGSGRLQIALGKNLPRLADKYMKRSLFEQQKTYDRDHVDEGNLERPQADGRAWGLHKGHVMRSSAYTTATLSPVLTTMAFAAAGLTLAAGVKRWRTAA
ncbi:MAG TPA: SDR family oxidoreductase [Vicinamibacterales bacterium]|jgi:short-subunit dehydrogenase|nr:SDR family oxidoreductase [Vicinamibacterales bacterium]